MTAAKARILVTIIAADVMLMPVIPVLFLPASFVLVAALLILQWRRVCFRLNWRAQLFVAMVLSSLMLSYLTKPSSVAVSNSVLTAYVSTHQEDTKRALHLMLALALYAVARYLIRLGGVAATTSTLRVVTVVALLSSGVMFLLFVISPDSYASIRSLLFGTNVDLSGIDELRSAGYFARFSYVLLDPNNAAYYMLALAMFAVHNLRLPRILEGYCVLLIVVVPFATRSLGSMYAVIAYSVASGLLFLSTRKSARVHATVLLISSVLVGLALLDSLFNLGLIEKTIHTQTAVFDRWESNSADSRIGNWRALLGGSLPPIIGSGYVLIVDGHWFNPHSDHFRILYAYGAIAYACVVAEAVCGRYLHRRFLFLIPILTAFSVNSFMDEPRFLFSGVLLLAFAKVTIASEVTGSESTGSDSALEPSTMLASSRSAR